MRRDILENRIERLECAFNIKNENEQSDHDLREIIYASLDDKRINESWLIDECLALMTEEQLLDLCYNMNIEI
jgi:hypothetical protein